MLASGRGLLPVRAHAVELARAHAIDELTHLHEEQANMTEVARQRKRAANLRLLSRLSPGQGKFVQATRDAHGTLHTQPAEIAADSRAHCLFSQKN